jgi:hypothetical protein
MIRRVKVLGVDVDEARVDRWMSWIAPPVQPFVVDARGPLPTGARTDVDLPLELRDTYQLYGLTPDVRLAWLDETTFSALSRSDRATLVRAQVRRERDVVPTVRAWGTGSTQGDGHRFVWWPSMVAGQEERLVDAYVARGRPSSRHAEVERETWAEACPALPAAEEIAGTFPSTSGPNCFTTVMTAAGATITPDQWMKREPFDAWLDAACSRGGADDRPGTVLVWSSSDGLVQHAAVTLGHGWALHKPSQGWMSPVMALRLRELMAMCRTPGLRVRRWSIR